MIDKPPLSVWPMAAAVKVFGLSSWSVLAPQAVIGILTVWATVALVRRSTGSAAAGLVAGLVLAITPVATLMFRFNNPDALLTLVLVGAAAATLRSVEIDAGHPLRWIVLAGGLVGVAFLVKMLQAFLVLPALALVYLVAASAPWWSRLGHLLLALGATAGVAGTWVALVASWPAESRPFIGSTTDNSILELVGGYNGLERLTGGESGPGSDFAAEAGALRMLNGELGGQIGWLLPTALLVVGLVLWLRREQSRSDPVRVAAALWGTWLVTGVAVFSAMSGIFHAYYTVVLAPAIAALIGIGWHALSSRPRLAVIPVLVTTVTSVVLLGRSVEFAPWMPWLPWLVVAAGVVALVLLGAGRGRHAVLAVLVVALAGPASYAVDTAGTQHRGSVPVAGPMTTGRPVRAPATAYDDNLRGVLDTPGIDALLRATTTRWAAAVRRSNPAGGFQLASRRPVIAVGGFSAADPFPTPPQFARWVRQGQVSYYVVVEPDNGPILDWVQAERFPMTVIDGFTVFDLTAGARVS